MKKSLLFLSLASIFFFGVPEASFAKKKYRYIKREHGVGFQSTIMNTNLSLQGVYTYNWKGRMEGGFYVNLRDISLLPPEFSDVSGGLIGEYNFVKNRGKVKFVPAAGLSVGVNAGTGMDLTFGVHTSLKYFVAKRTPFVVKIGYLGVIPKSFDIASLNHNIDISTGFSYYFDFY